MVANSILSAGVTVVGGTELDGAVIGEERRCSDAMRGRSVGEPRSDPFDGGDRGDMLDAARAMPDHLRDALWRIETARAAHDGGARGLRLRYGRFGDRRRPGDRGPRRTGSPSRCWSPAATSFPPGPRPGSAVLCSSYSGNTEETLACYAAAEALGAQRLVATTGGELADAARADDVPVIGLPAGLQPRAAVGYMFCVAAELAALALAGPRIHTEIDAAASHLGEAFEAAHARANELAEQIGDATPVTLRQRPDRPGRLPLEVPDQRERQDPGLLGECCPRPTTTSSRAGAGRDGRFAAIFLARQRPAPARAQALRAHREGRSSPTPRR